MVFKELSSPISTYLQNCHRVFINDDFLETIADGASLKPIFVGVITIEMGLFMIHE